MERCLQSSWGHWAIESVDSTILFIQHYISSLKSGGKATIIVPSVFFTSTFKHYVTFRKYLIENCNLYGVLELPRGIFSFTGISSLVIFIEKTRSTQTIKYYLKPKDETYQGFLDFFIDGAQNSNAFFYDVKNIDSKNYVLPLARKFAIDEEIKTRTKNFNQFQCYDFCEFCKEVNQTKELFEEKPNTVYLPKMGKFAPVARLEQSPTVHQRYFQLVLDESKILSSYMIYFLKSSLGEMLLEGIFTESLIQRISKTKLKEEMKIYAPAKDEQILIGNALTELESVHKLMEETTIELCSNPDSASRILDKIHSTKNVFNQLSDEERIVRLIDGGENLKVEFKETLSLNIHTEKKDDALHDAVLKNVVGFLNKDGGCLLIGVADSGEIKGIEKDFYKSDDRYKLRLSDLIDKHIGTKEINFIHYRIVTVNDKKVCEIVCDKSPEPAYFNEEFYVRVDPKTKKLSSKEANEYIEKHFQKE